MFTFSFRIASTTSSNARAVELEPRQIHVDLHLPLETAAEIRPKDLGDLLDSVLEVLSDLLQADEAILTGQVHLHDRHFGEVELHDRRLVRVWGELGLRETHLLPNLLERFLQVRPHGELGP